MNPALAQCQLFAKVPPHGLIGQVWDGDDISVIGATDEYKGAEITTKAMGEGAIEGVAADYKMADQFATDFKYSRFRKVHIPTTYSYSSPSEYYLNMTLCLLHSFAAFVRLRY